MKKKVHLVCNAHLDPVWLWQWEDGLAEAISTFRVAADFCEKYNGFVFNHNESILYGWVEEYAPELFERIKDLVREGKWHITGGSYLQPDLNLTGGESHIRHFLYGKHYFMEKFGIEPETAYNFDPFGQPEGYAQILKGCGFKHYIFCRPDYGTWDLPVGAFQWTDRSQAGLIARRSDDHYNNKGDLYEKLKKWIKHYKDEPEVLILWGIGNHGGGASEKDMEVIEKFRKETFDEYELIHSYPENFFKTVEKHQKDLSVYTGEMQNSHQGCYTSMSRVKRAHRKVENMIQVTEKMATFLWYRGIADYPDSELKALWKKLLFSQFHDILPGSCIPSAEKDALNLLGGAESRLRELQNALFIKAIRLTGKPEKGDVPVYVWNPHPYRISDYGVAAYLMAYEESPLGHKSIVLTDEEGNQLPFQRVKAEANVGVASGVVKIIFPVHLNPFEWKRYNASFIMKKTEFYKSPALSSNIKLKNSGFQIVINTKTGLVDKWIPSKEGSGGGHLSVVKKGAFAPVVYEDLDHSWTVGNPADFFEKEKIKDLNVGITSVPWGKVKGRFKLAKGKRLYEVIPPPEKKRGNKPSVKPVSVIENGPVRTVVEAVFVYKKSAIVRHYRIYHDTPLFEIKERIFWNERDMMLKTEIPADFDIKKTVSETPYSAVSRPNLDDHVELPNQRWVSAVGERGGSFITAVNTGSYAHSVSGNCLYINMMRSPAYASFNLSDAFDIYTKRFNERQDLGEHVTELRFYAGSGSLDDPEEKNAVKAADLLNQKPQVSVFYSGGITEKKVIETPLSGWKGATVDVDKSNVFITAFKKSHSGSAAVLRVREVEGKKTAFRLNFFDHKYDLSINAYEIFTVKIDQEGRLIPVNFIEQEKSSG